MIFAKNFARNYEKNNTWNIIRLVNETIVPSTQRIILKIVGFYVRELCIDHLSAFVEKSLCLFTHFELHHL